MVSSQVRFFSRPSMLDPQTGAPPNAKRPSTPTPTHHQRPQRMRTRPNPNLFNRSASSGQVKPLKVDQEPQAGRALSRVPSCQNAENRGAENRPCFPILSCKLATHRMGVVVSDACPAFLLVEHRICQVLVCMDVRSLAADRKPSRC